VFGVPDADLGEVPLAAVQPADPDAPTDSLEAALRALCRARLARYKNPARYEFLDSLPRGDDGKLRKKPLRDQYWGEGSKILRA
jgi:acyl-CoA synthetase (AMP-forming)/AMP-acid ligase II